MQSLHIAPKFFRNPGLLVPRISSGTRASTPCMICSPSFPNPLFRRRSRMPPPVDGRGRRRRCSDRTGEPRWRLRGTADAPRFRAPRPPSGSPHPISHPAGDSRSMRVVRASRPAVWSRQRARSGTRTLSPSSAQPLLQESPPPRPEVVMTVTKMATGTARQTVQLFPDSFTSFVQRD